MGYMVPSKDQNSRDAILELLSRLWQTKLRSITLLEKWLAKTGDLDIKAGLKAQIEDERRHLRILSDEIKRLGGRLGGPSGEQFFDRPFVIVQAQGKDAQRLATFYYGIKAFTLDRCSKLIPFVDLALSRTLEQIAREEDRHIRWAELRLQRLLDVDEARQCKMLVERMEATLEAVWSKPWQRLNLLRHRVMPSYMRRRAG
jgi:rubrerythrin